MYTIDEIKKVLWNTFKTTISKIDIVDNSKDGNNEYLFLVYPDVDSTLDEITNIAEELYDTDLFDITMQNDHLIIEYLGDFVLEFKAFKFINEAISKTIEFNDEQIKGITQLYNKLNVKYHNNQYVKNIYDKLLKNKKLTKNQYEDFNYLLKKGRTRYEDNQLSKKH